MKGVLPEEIRFRKKQPFYSPIQEWFFSENSPEFVDELLSARALRDSELFNPGVVEKLRGMLDEVKKNSLLRHQIEWLLILILGSQILHERFVKGLSNLSPLTKNSFLLKRMNERTILAP